MEPASEQKPSDPPSLPGWPAHGDGSSSRIAREWRIVVTIVAILVLIVGVLYVAGYLVLTAGPPKSAIIAKFALPESREVTVRVPSRFLKDKLHLETGLADEEQTHRIQRAAVLVEATYRNRGQKPFKVAPPRYGGEEYDRLQDMLVLKPGQSAPAYEGLLVDFIVEARAGEVLSVQPIPWNGPRDGIELEISLRFTHLENVEKPEALVFLATPPFHSL